jgi:predicted TIM-barrel fold metal-dependent hydrolase
MILAQKPSNYTLDITIILCLPLDQINRTALAFPLARIVVTGCSGEEVKLLSQQKDCSNLYFEISNDNAPLDPIREISQHIAPERLLLGTNYPHQYMLPSIRKLDNSILENSIKQNIACDNAQRLLKI